MEESGTARRLTVLIITAVVATQSSEIKLQLFPKINYRHRTDTTRMQINTSIYHRPLLTTGNFTGIYII